QRLGGLGRGCPGEARPQAARSIGRERELRHEQQAAARVTNRQIHASGGIGENAVTDQPLREPLGFVCAVGLLHADEHEQSRADLADDLALDRDARLRDSLDETDHSFPLEWLNPWTITDRLN